MAWKYLTGMIQLNMATECIGAMVLITKLFQTDSNLVLFISLFVNCSVNLWHTVQYSILQDRTVQNSKVQLSPVRQLSCKDKWNCANCRIKWYCIVEYSVIQYNRIQYNRHQLNTTILQYNKVQYNIMLYFTVLYCILLYYT